MRSPGAVHKVDYRESGEVAGDVLRSCALLGSFKLVRQSNVVRLSIERMLSLERRAANGLL